MAATSGRPAAGKARDRGITGRLIGGSVKVTIGDNRVAAGSTMLDRVRHPGRRHAQNLNPGLTVIAPPDMNARLSERRKQVRITASNVTVRHGSNVMLARRRTGL